MSAGVNQNHCRIKIRYVNHWNTKGRMKKMMVHSYHVMGPVSGSWKCWDKTSQENSENYCENYYKLKSEHQKILDELKLAQVIIEIHVLWAEMKDNLASEYVTKDNTNNIHTNNQHEASKNRWSKVITGHHKGREVKYFIKQANK